MSASCSVLSTPFAVLTPPDVENADGELTETPVPIVAPELLQEVADQLDALQLNEH